MQPPRITRRVGAKIFDPAVFALTTPVMTNPMTVNPTMLSATWPVVGANAPANGINPPIVNPDIASTVVNTPVTTNILANDNAANLGASLNPASVSIVTQPKYGTVIVNADGTIIYTPANGFIGTDSLVYSVCDNSAPTPICKNSLLDSCFDCELDTSNKSDKKKCGTSVGTCNHGYHLHCINTWIYT